MVTQKDSLGCGVASVAYVLGVTYDNALEQFDIGKVKAVGCYCKDIIEVLEQNNKKCVYKYVGNQTQRIVYRQNTIVYIKKSKKYPRGHYLVRVKNGWHDSWINFTNEKNVCAAKSGIRKRLPDRVIYAIFIG